MMIERWVLWTAITGVLALLVEVAAFMYALGYERGEKENDSRKI